MPTTSKTRAEEVRSLAHGLYSREGKLTLAGLRKAVAKHWGVDVNHVRSEYLLTALVSHSESSLLFMIDGDSITVTSQIPQSRKARLSPDEFVYLMIEHLPWCLYRGAIHTVLSRFNPAFRLYFPDIDPVEYTRQMASEKKIYVKPITGGVLISREPFKRAVTPQETLELLGLS